MNPVNFLFIFSQELKLPVIVLFRRSGTEILATKLTQKLEREWRKKLAKFGRRICGAGFQWSWSVLGWSPWLLQSWSSFKFCRYSGDLNSKYLNSGNIWMANFYLFIIRMVQHLNSKCVSKWLSEYQTSMVPGIWIANHSMSEQIPVIWILNQFAIQISTV